jgi:hypothetical protein
MALIDGGRGTLGTTAGFKRMSTHCTLWAGRVALTSSPP